MNHSLFYKANTNNAQFSTYIDADYAESDGRKSTPSNLHPLFNFSVSWHSKKHVVFTLSSCEAEYITGNRALQHALKLRRLFDSMLIAPEQQTKQFYMDNSSATKISQHQSKSHLRNHLVVRHHHLVCHVRQTTYNYTTPQARQIKQAYSPRPLRQITSARRPRQSYTPTTIRGPPLISTTANAGAPESVTMQSHLHHTIYTTRRLVEHTVA